MPGSDAWEEKPGRYGKDSACELLASLAWPTMEALSQVLLTVAVVICMASLCISEIELKLNASF